MNDWRVRYLFLLAAVIVGAQVAEFCFVLDVAANAPRGNQPPVQYRFSDWLTPLAMVIGPCVIPPLAFAFAARFLFRNFTWAMWLLVAGASIYAAFMLLGLLVEFVMAREAAAAAARGSQYMNCGGHPRLFIILFSPPLTIGVFLACGVALAVEAVLNELFAKR